MSQLTTEKTKIGEHEYEMHMLDPLTSHDLLMDVAKMIGPAIGPVFDRLFQNKKVTDLEGVLDQNIGVDFFSSAADSLFKGIDKKVLRNVIDEFQKVTFVDGTELSKTFAIHFRGALDSMYQWIAWGMSVQWGKSLSALVGAIPFQKSDENKNEKLESPMVSTG